MGEEILIVAGHELQPYDTILDFVPGKHITLDHQGLVEITHPAENITREENTYIGFCSFDSASILSYKIDLEEEYRIVRDN